MLKKFQKTVEDFVCLHCGRAVFGSGYTNHCPNCLWSRHVDINPGDRMSNCHGMMRPLRVELDHSEQNLIFKCQECGVEKTNKIAENDSVDALISLAKKRKF